MAQASCAQSGSVRVDASEMVSCEAERLEYGSFAQWYWQCRVRNTQEETTKLVDAARENNRSLDEELHTRGFNNVDAFRASCEQFNLRCDITALAELGSGFVLYFSLVKFMALLLLFCGILQIPALVIYGGKNSLEAWWWHDWSRGHDLNAQEGCACIGSNGGFHGPVPALTNSSYGTACAPWDLQWCLGGSLPLNQLGKWCCRSWCFAGPGCEETSFRSRSNRRYRGMVRASSACEQDDRLLRQSCSSLDDVAFDESGVVEIYQHLYIENWYLTPGNFGPGQADHNSILVMHLLCVVLLCVAIVVKIQHQIMLASRVSSVTTLPSDFALLVKGLPPTAVDEREILDFFRAHAVSGQSDMEIVKVVIGWNAAEFQSMATELRKSRAQLKRAREAGDTKTCDVVTAQIRQVLSTLEDSSATGNLRSSGTVVVVFRYQEDQRDCRQRWDTLWASWFGLDVAGRWCFCCFPALPRLVCGDGPGVVPIVTAAPNPGDINWEQLGVGTAEKYRLKRNTNAMMLGLIVASFLLTWAMNAWQQAATDLSRTQSTAEEAYAFRALSVVPAGIVFVINLVLREAAKWFGAKEIQKTRTEEEFSQAFKISLAMIINTGFTILWINMQPSEWYEKGGLVDDLKWLLLSDAFGARLFFLVDFRYLRKCIRRRRLTKAKVTDWNQKLLDNSPPKTGEQEEALREVSEETELFKDAFAPSELDSPDRYARALTTFLCCLFYSPLFPAATFIGAAGLAVQYLIDKYILLRWSRRPRYQSELQAMWTLWTIKFLAPFSLSFGLFVFLMPSWRNRRNVFGAFVLCLAVAGGLWFLPSVVWRTLCGCRLVLPSDKGAKRKDQSTRAGHDYYEAQHLWPRQMQYHLDQFVYKQLPRTKNPDILGPDVDAIVSADDVRALLTAAGSVDRESVKSDGLDTASPPPPHGSSSGTVAHVQTSLTSQSTYGKEQVVSAAAVWLFEVSVGFKTCAPESQAPIEQHYKEYISCGGPSQVKVPVGSTTISVDFVRMTQKMLPDGKVRALKRLEKSC